MMIVDIGLLTVPRRGRLCFSWEISWKVIILFWRYRALDIKSTVTANGGGFENTNVSGIFEWK